uniref:Arthropod insulin-like growth factor 1 n=2 Tax=Tenebrio molitor TaxID=7067 RepID=A0A977SQ65_TENMO|nr:arthropod insulin-like growth factor 1 [Tenebrio molitor]
MNVPKGWIKMLCLVAAIGQISANIDSKEYFCGKKLVRTLTELCSIYNNPTYARNRFRRQIVDECCRSPCTRRYLVLYYCSEAKSSVVSLLNRTKPENSSKQEKTGRSEPSPSEERNSLTRIKKLRRMQSPRNMIHNPVPPAKLGHVEHSQRPFYVWKFSRVY